VRCRREARDGDDALDDCALPAAVGDRTVPARLCSASSALRSRGRGAREEPTNERLPRVLAPRRDARRRERLVGRHGVDVHVQPEDEERRERVREREDARRGDNAAAGPAGPSQGGPCASKGETATHLRAPTDGMHEPMKKAAAQNRTTSTPQTIRPLLVMRGGPLSRPSTMLM